MSSLLRLVYNEWLYLQFISERVFSSLTFLLVEWILWGTRGWEKYCIKYSLKMNKMFPTLKITVQDIFVIHWNSNLKSVSNNDISWDGRNNFDFQIKICFRFCSKIYINSQQKVTLDLKILSYITNIIHWDVYGKIIILIPLSNSKQDFSRGKGEGVIFGFWKN